MRTDKAITHSRDLYIDALRAGALMCLLIAHTWAPTWMTIIRSFDVPLMVFISAICFHPSRNGYFYYIKKRFIRIYKPVFIFLVIFFLTTWVGSFYISKLDFGFEKIFGSFLLLNHPSIGYVWIMRVFLMAALIIPVIYDTILKLSPIVIIIINTVLFVAVEVFYVFIQHIESPFFIFISKEYIQYFLAYTYIIIWAIACINAARKTMILYMLMLLLTFVACYISFNSFDINPIHSKYPPHGAYLIYGSFMSVLLLTLRPNRDITLPKSVMYLSENSMWLYLWHIIPVYALIPFSGVPNTWFLRYCIVFVVMLMITYAYTKVCDWLKRVIRQNNES